MQQSGTTWGERTIPPSVAYDDAPLQRFHLRVTVASFGGVFSDGFGLGTIGLVLTLSARDLQLNSLWLGLIGGASLIGLFFGALLTGPIADRRGRRPVFAYNMLLLALVTSGQFLVQSAAQLLIFRLVIGLLLGSDYVVSKALLTEFTPRSFRGRIMSTLSIAWAGGYACAYLLSYALLSMPGDAWRWMLLAGAAPCLLVLPLRLTLPESPLWLAANGHGEDAARVVRHYLGPHVNPPAAPIAAAQAPGRWSSLFLPAWRRRTLVGCAFFTCQVIPYFAIGTFVTRVMQALSVPQGFLGGVLYNLSLLLGAVGGFLVVDRMPRRVFLVGSFVLTAATLLVMIVTPALPAAATITLFALFAGVLSAASNLVYVYLPELFPTELRGSGVGLAIAASRLGSAGSTFLLPVIVDAYGARVALSCCCVVLVIGGLICQRWAPETRHRRLTDPVS
jgi:putative MFS transporter